MPRLTKKALLKHLNKSDKEDIIREVVTIFDKFKNVREFYSAELTDEANPLLLKYKRKIAEAYARPNPKEKTTNSNINRLVAEFKKVSIYNRDTADLMLYRVECGVAAFGHDINRTATFYNSILTTFDTAIRLIYSEGYEEEFKVRIKKVVKDAEPGKYAIAERMADIAIRI